MIWGYPYFRNPPFESYLNIVLSCFPLGLLKPLLSGNHEPHGWIARNLHSQRQKYNSSKRCRECALAQWAFWCFWVDTHVITRQFCWISMADLSSKVGSLRSVCVETPQIHRLITIYIHIYIYNVMIFYICVMLFEIRQTLPICFSWVAYKFKCSRLRGHSYFLTSPCWLLLASCRSFVHHLLRMDRHRVSQWLCWLTVCRLYHYFGPVVWTRIFINFHSYSLIFINVH